MRMRCAAARLEATSWRLMKSFVQFLLFVLAITLALAGLYAWKSGQFERGGTPAPAGAHALPNVKPALGAGGDLTSRLLLPGLASLLGSSRGSDIRLIGVDRDAVTPAAWTRRVAKAFGKAGGPRAASVASSRSSPTSARG